MSKALSRGTVDKGKTAVVPRDLKALSTCGLDRYAILAAVVGHGLGLGLACLCVPAPPEQVGCKRWRLVVGCWWPWALLLVALGWHG